mmetsp:Transcript_93702/g.264465  ORF Transcript_93702/g.264465 Transcript_93702/m.264465 type:complete len:253 (-) Transcript_93702:305-1063(-)
MSARRRWRHPWLTTSRFGGPAPSAAGEACSAAPPGLLASRLRLGSWEPLPPCCAQEQWQPRQRHSETPSLYYVFPPALMGCRCAQPSVGSLDNTTQMLRSQEIRRGSGRLPGPQRSSQRRRAAGGGNGSDKSLHSSRPPLTGGPPCNGPPPSVLLLGPASGPVLRPPLGRLPPLNEPLLHGQLLPRLLRRQTPPVESMRGTPPRRVRLQRPRPREALRKGPMLFARPLRPGRPQPRRPQRRCGSRRTRMTRT